MQGVQRGQLASQQLKHPCACLELLSADAHGLAGIKNIMRGALLATAATFIGCALFFTLPDFVAAQLNKAMPYWFYESEVGHSELHFLAHKALV